MIKIVNGCKDLTDDDLIKLTREFILEIDNRGLKSRLIGLDEVDMSEEILISMFNDPVIKKNLKKILEILDKKIPKS